MKHSPLRLLGIIIGAFLLFFFSLPSTYGQSSLTVPEQKQLASVLSALQGVLARLNSALSALIPSRSQGLAAVSASLSQGLVGYWKFDEGTGTSAADSSGNNNTGTLTNGPKQVIGQVGQALSFDGGDDFVNAQSPATLDNLAPISVSWWVKANALGGHFFGKSNWNNSFGWKISYLWNSLTNIDVSIGFSTSGIRVTSSGTGLTTGVWTHLVYTWDGSTTATNVHLYKNGTEVSYDTQTNASGTRDDDSTHPFYVGSTQGGSFINGSMDEVRIYNRVLSPSEIQELYTAGGGTITPPAPTPPPPVSPPQLTAGGIVSLPPEVMGPNVSPNSGFENLTSGQPTGWSWWNSPFTADTTVKRSGTASLRLTAPASATDTASYKVFLKKGTYNLSGYIKTQGLTSAEPNLDGVRMEVTTGGWPPCCGAGYGQPVYVSAGDVDWTYREETRITITVDTDVYITVRALGSITGGQVWFDDIEFREVLPKPLDVFMLYPNYRGYLFDDYSQTTRFDVTVTPPTGTALSAYRVDAAIFDEISSATVRTDTFTPTSPNFIVNINGSGFINDRTYLIAFKLRRLSDSALVYEYPSYRVSKIAGSKRSAMTVAFDEQNRMLIRGQPFFPLSVFDAGTPLTTSPSAWESTLTTYRRLFEIPLNNYLNYQNGGAHNASILPLLDLFQSKGITDFGIANCFERTTVDASNTQYPFWLLNASEADIKTRAEHPAFLGFYVNDECHHSMVPNTFMHYQDIKRLDPDGITLGSSNQPGSMYLWRDSLDLFAMDPYPLYGTEPSGGYPLQMVADWIIGLRNDVKSSRPFWIDLQFFQASGAAPWPTAAEMRNMAYMGIAEGANGVTWWSLGVRALAWVCTPSTDWCAARVDYYNRLKLIMNELKSLEPVLLSDDRPDLLVSNSNPSIHTRVKYQGGKGYIISYNYTNATTAATFTWSQTPTNVTVYNEGRTITPSGTNFTDTFGPYAAHVYEISMTGSLPPLPPPTPVPAPIPAPTPTPTPTPSPTPTPVPTPTPTPSPTPTPTPTPVPTPPPSSGGGGSGGGSSGGGGGGGGGFSPIEPISVRTPGGDGGFPAPVPTPSAISSLPLLTQTLYRGIRNTEVTTLQKFLITKNYLASGNDTGYFGLATFNALKRYQCERSIVCSGNEASTGYGSVGPQTRALINKEAGEISAPPLPFGIPPTEVARQTLIAQLKEQIKQLQIQLLELQLKLLQEQLQSVQL